MPAPKRDQRSTPAGSLIAPRLASHLETVDLATITTGEWEQVELTGTLPADFDEPLILTEVRLTGASLAGCRLEGSRLVDVASDATDLSGCDLGGASLARVSVHDARMSGTRMSQVRLRDVRITGSQLDDANLALTTGERLVFDRCRMRRADFREARLEHVAWWDSDLTEADFSQITVTAAQMHGSTLDGVQGARALAPLAVDAEQFDAFARHVLASLGIEVRPREEL